MDSGGVGDKGRGGEREEDGQLREGKVSLNACLEVDLLPSETSDPVVAGEGRAI